MRLCVIQLDRTSAKEATDEQIEQLNRALVHGPEFKRDKDGDLNYWYDVLVDPNKIPVGIAYDVKKTVVPSDDEWYRQNPVERVPAFNEKVNVVVPGLGLLLIDEVKVQTDCCTEALNDRLKEGWRILAICPQPDQRRPDYVLGRSGKRDI